MRVGITDSPLSQRRFHGLGVQADAYIYDNVNREAGVTGDDLGMLERRLRALRPAVARLFVEVPWFNPGLDGATFHWDNPGYVNLVRQLRLLQGLAAEVNLVLFLPMFPAVAQMTPVVRAMIALLERLAAAEGIRAVRWLTLWNEPDSIFPHASPLSRRIFGEEQLRTRPPWSEYVRVNQEAYALLGERGLYPQIRLLVADCVWGGPLRAERMQLSLESFRDLDVDYSYHNYNPEDLAFYRGKPDYAYEGMTREAAAFRRLLGPERQLMLWEFNTPGIAGFHSHFLGVGPAGVDRVSSIEGAVELTDKVLLAAAAGVDGFCLWCLHDMLYCGNAKSGLMYCGLWRGKQQGWRPRPIYHYYAALMQAFRPGTRLLRTTGGGRSVSALAGDGTDSRVVALLNRGARRVRIDLTLTPAQGWRRERIYPEILPAAADLPASAGESVASAAGEPLRLTLEPAELTILQGKP